MNIDRLRYIYLLDEIRTKKNLSVEKLCENICSTRQYRKYLSGDNNISDARITEFCNVLNISTRDFYYSLSKHDNFDFEKVSTIYKKLTQKKYQEVAELLNEITIKSDLSVQNKKYLEYCKTRYNLETKKIYPDEGVENLSKVINYPECESNSAFDFIDIMALLTIAEIEIKVQNETALNLLIKILNNKDLLFLSAEVRNILPPIYSGASVFLGRLKKYSEVVIVASAGIEFCNKYHFSKSLTWLYYTLALAYKNLNKLTLAEEHVVLCMTNVISRGNKSHINTFYKLALKDFNKDPFLMIMDHKQNILKLGD